jgi:hypothetical protein
MVESGVAVARVWWCRRRKGRSSDISVSMVESGVVVAWWRRRRKELSSDISVSGMAVARVWWRR